METTVEHECEHFLMTDVAVHECECGSLILNGDKEYVEKHHLTAIEKDNRAWQSEYRAARVEVERLKLERDELTLKYEALRAELTKPHEEEIFVASSSPEAVYTAFTDKSRAAFDSAEAGVEFCSIKLHRGPKIKDN